MSGEVKALIADDDEFFRMALKSILIGKLGCSEVVETESLDAAIEQLASRKGEFTLALFDLGMPGMESPASLRQVCRSEERTKVAVVSGSSRRVDILAALDAGCYGYVTKGAGVGELQRALESIVNGDIFVPPILLRDASVDDEAYVSASSRAVFYLSGDGDMKSDRALAAALDNMTPKQKQVLKLLIGGKTRKQIGRELSVQEGTVKAHLQSVYKHLGVDNRASAAATGQRAFLAYEKINGRPFMAGMAQV